MFKYRIDNTKSNSLTKEERRLDSLAKFLTGSSVCATVTLELNVNNQSPQLLVSTNKITKNEAENFNILYLKNETKKLKAALDVLHQGVISDVDKQDYLNKFLGSLCTVIFKTKVKNSTNIINQEIKNFLNYIDTITSNDGVPSCNYQAAKKFFEKKEEILSAAPKGAWGRPNPASPEYIEATSFFKYLKYALQQSKKIAQILFTEDLPNIKEAIKNYNFKIIGPHHNDYIKDSDKGKDAHSEMNIVNHLIKENAKGTFYLATSKLNCFDCHNDLTIINNSPNTKDLKLTTRGTHNVDYSAGRIIPDFKIYVIEAHRARYSNLDCDKQGESPELADFSDSDIDDSALDGMLSLN